MDIAPMNKTAVIEFGLMELVLKLWQVNKKMRKKIKWILKNKNITVKYYNQKVFFLKDWVQVGREQLKIRDNLKVKKGISNYEVQNQCNVDVLLHLNKKLHCVLSLSEEIEASYFDYVRLLEVESSTIRFYNNLSFNRVDELKLKYMEYAQITSILGQINRIEELTITGTKLGWLDLSFLKPRLIEFKTVKFTKIVRLPMFVEHLELDNCEQFDLISFKKLTELAVFSKKQLRKEELNWIKRIYGLKNILIETSTQNCISCLPTTIRTISGKFYMKDAFNICDIRKKFPYLIGIHDDVPLSLVEKLNLRWICESIEEKIEKTFNVRPKEISVTEENYKVLNKHPEIFLGATNIVVYTGKFSLDCVPYGVEKICFVRMNLKSRKLIRLGEEPLEI